MTNPSINQCASKIVEQIVADLSDRRGLRHEWDQIDDDIQAEIISQWTAIAEREITVVIK
jgi:hypothetical protein